MSTKGKGVSEHKNTLVEKVLDSDATSIVFVEEVRSIEESLRSIHPYHEDCPLIRRTLETRIHRLEWTSTD